MERCAGLNCIGSDSANDISQDNDFLRDIWKPRPFISAGGYTRQLALEGAQTKNDLIAIGRLFISNVGCSHIFKLFVAYEHALQPDLPMRWKQNIHAGKGDCARYYMAQGPVGYTDYPFADDCG